MDDLSEDALLGGRLEIRQPKRGFRVTSDAVLLAALAPFEPTDSLLELGCGYGQVSLCLAARVASAPITGVELLPDVAALARENVILNNMADRITVVTASVKHLALGRLFRRIVANPPYRQPARHTLSPDRAKNYANYEMDGVTLADWVAAAVRHLAPGGTVSFIHDAARQAELSDTFRAAGLGLQKILPLTPREGAPASRIVIIAAAGAGPAVHLPPLALHERDGSWRAAVKAVLMSALPLDAGQA